MNLAAQRFSRFQISVKFIAIKRQSWIATAFDSLVVIQLRQMLVSFTQFQNHVVFLLQLGIQFSISLTQRPVFCVPGAQLFGMRMQQLWQFSIRAFIFGQRRVLSLVQCLQQAILIGQCLQIHRINSNPTQSHTRLTEMCCRASVNWFWRTLKRSIRAEITRCRTSDDFDKLEPFPEWMLIDLRRCIVDLELALLNEYKLSILFDGALAQNERKQEKTWKMSVWTTKWIWCQAVYQMLLSFRFSSSLVADMVVMWCAINYYLPPKMI